MQAIVLYRSRETSCFVLWCADQGALAILPDGVCGLSPPKIGDLIEADLTEHVGARICKGFTLIRAEALQGAAEILRKEAAREARLHPQNVEFPSLQPSG